MMSVRAEMEYQASLALDHVSRDMVLDWITERLDRKFVSAMERCVHEPPDRKKEMRLLKRTVLVLVCLGLLISVVSIKLSVEAQMAYAILG